MALYHHHIPRTSGLHIRDSINTLFQTNGIKSNSFYLNYPVNSEIIKDSHFISGHLANYPSTVLDNLKSFTIVRDPIERFISWFFYLYGNSMPHNELINIFNSWLYDKDMSDTLSNIQTKFLTGTLNIEGYNKKQGAFEKNANGWYVIDYNYDHDYILEKIESISCYTVENRDMLLDDINNYLFNHYGLGPIFNKRFKYNPSTKDRFEITDKMINRITELNQHDIFLYESVKAYKPKTL